MTKRNVVAALVLAGTSGLVVACGSSPATDPRTAEPPVEHAVRTQRVALHVDKMT